MADRYETQDVQWLIDDFHGKSFNAIEPGVCNLHFVWACQTGQAGARVWGNPHVHCPWQVGFGFSQVRQSIPRTEHDMEDV